MPAAELTKTDAVTVRRKTERADYHRDSANAILDEALVAHVGISVDGQPFVIPMAFGRDGDRLILHGSNGSRLLRSLGDGGPSEQPRVGLPVRAALIGSPNAGFAGVQPRQQRTGRAGGS